MRLTPLIVIPALSVIALSRIFKRNAYYLRLYAKFALQFGDGNLPLQAYHAAQLILLERARREEAEELPHVNTASSSTTMGASHMSSPSGPGEPPFECNLVLLGGGHSHAFVAKSLGMMPIDPRVRVTIISDGYDTPYSGMLPAYVAGKYSHRDCHLDVARFAQFAGARLIIGHVVKVDPRARLIYVAQPQYDDGTTTTTIEYDVLSINVGSSPRFPPRVSPDSVTPVKPISTFSARWNDIVRTYTTERAPRDLTVRIAVVGAGAGGVELLLAMRYRLENLRKAGKTANNRFEFTLFSKDVRLTPSHHKRVGELLLSVMRKLGVEVRFRVKIEEVVKADASSSSLIDETGAKHAGFHHVIWCTDARTDSFLAEAFPTTDTFVDVDDELRVMGQDGRVFAAGDCANQVNNPRAKAGVFAVRAGPVLSHNLRATCKAMLLSSPNEEQKTPPINLVPFLPQTHFLGIIGTYDDEIEAVASKSDLVLSGPELWKLKNWIDVTWMKSYTEKLKAGAMVPDGTVREMETGGRALRQTMSRLATTGTDLVARGGMRCGGCGSKIGPSVLNRVLNRLSQDPTLSLPESLRRDVFFQANADEEDLPRDDCAVVRPPGSMNSSPPPYLTVETVDFYRASYSCQDEYLFARVAANHSLSDVHAMGDARARTALCVAVVPYSPRSAIVEARLFRLMAGASAFLNREGCALVGGNSSEGSELMMGFAVSGVVTDPTRLKRKLFSPSSSSLSSPPRFKLILTKALGTGVLMKAHAEVRCRGRWLGGALKGMLQSNAAAGKIFSKWNAACVTDVTGFGLVNHLGEMTGSLEAPVKSITLWLRRIPILEGARECARAGIHSSLFPQNFSHGHKYVANNAELLLATSPAIFDYALLFDPQTAGGLLGIVPESSAEACLEELIAAGYSDASAIGELEASSERVVAGGCRSRYVVVEYEIDE